MTLQGHLTPDTSDTLAMPAISTLDMPTKDTEAIERVFRAIQRQVRWTEIDATRLRAGRRNTDALKFPESLHEEVEAAI